MKKVLSVFLSAVMTTSLTACGSSTNEGTVDAGQVEAAAEQAAETVVNEEDQIVDEAWDELESLGKIETENGIFFVSITLPADIVGEEVTQESLDAKAGENYISAKLNDDGSVTYKMTKKQHKEMLDGMVESIDQSLQELVDSDQYAFADIKHNSDYTSFDVTLDTNELGMTESFMIIAFYMYGGIYGLFSGHEADNITVNFYSPDGTLINTGNSKDMES